MKINLKFNLHKLFKINNLKNQQIWFLLIKINFVFVNFILYIFKILFIKLIH